MKFHELSANGQSQADAFTPVVYTRAFTLFKGQEDPLKVILLNADPRIFDTYGSS